jgi:hypothetical protein
MNFQPRLPLPEPPQPLVFMLHPSAHRHLAALLKAEPGNKHAAGRAKLHDLLAKRIAGHLAAGRAKFSED